MISTISGDYSKYPASIRDAFPCLAGETMELGQAWGVYSRLFMEEQSRTELFASRLGGVLGMFQNQLQDELFISIARLTDKDSRDQENLSLWSLLVAIPETADETFSASVTDKLNAIYSAAYGIRKHRHKRLAHFDKNTNLKLSVLPVVTFREIREIITLMEEFLNVFYWQFERTTMIFDCLSPYDLSDRMETTVYKAEAYDALEQEGVIPRMEWRKRANRK